MTIDKYEVIDKYHKLPWVEDSFQIIKKIELLSTLSL
jgi:hypothetical protein